MSEKTQGTALGMREKMLNRYGDEYHHKHDKNHISYRKHFRTYPVTTAKAEDNKELNIQSTSQRKQFKLRKLRKRLDKGHFH